MKKERIYKIFSFISIFLIIAFIISLVYDYSNYNDFSNSAPINAFIGVRVLEFIIPSIISFIIALFFKQKGK